MVGPIDLAGLPSQTAAAEKVQQVQQQHPDMAQRQFALMLQEERRRKNTDVQDAERTEETRISKEQHRDSRARKHKGQDTAYDQDEGKGHDDSTDAEGTAQGRIVDIVV